MYAVARIAFRDDAGVFLQPPPPWCGERRMIGSVKARRAAGKLGVGQRDQRRPRFSTVPAWLASADGPTYATGHMIEIAAQTVAVTARLRRGQQRHGDVFTCPITLSEPQAMRPAPASACRVRENSVDPARKQRFPSREVSDETGSRFPVHRGARTASVSGALVWLSQEDDSIFGGHVLSAISSLHWRADMTPQRRCGSRILKSC